MFRAVVFRFIPAMIAANLAACLYYAAVDLETVLLGPIVALFVLPSVLLFVLMETIAHTRLAKYAGFIVPAIVVVGIYSSSFVFRAFVSPSDGAEAYDEGELFAISFLECYAIAIAVALAWLLWGPVGKATQRRNQKT